MCELVHEFDARVPFERAFAGERDDAPARIPVGMVGPEGVQEDGGVEEERAQSPARTGLGVRISRFIAGQSSTAIGLASSSRLPARARSGATFGYAPGRWPRE